MYLPLLVYKNCSTLLHTLRWSLSYQIGWFHMRWNNHQLWDDYVWKFSSIFGSGTYIPTHQAKGHDSIGLDGHACYLLVWPARPTPLSYSLCWNLKNNNLEWGTCKGLAGQTSVFACVSVEPSLVPRLLPAFQCCTQNNGQHWKAGRSLGMRLGWT